MKRIRVGALALLALVVAVGVHARSESFCPDRPGGTATAGRVVRAAVVGYPATVHTSFGRIFRRLSDE